MPGGLGAMVGQMAGNPGAMQPPQGPGFGLGQPLQQGGMGGQMAQPTGPQGQPGIMERMAGMFGGGQPGAAGQMQGQGPDMSKLGPMAMQLMAQQQQQQQAGQGMPMAPMAGAGMQQQPQTQAAAGYLAQGGGMQRRLVGRGY